MPSSQSKVIQKYLRPSIFDQVVIPDKHEYLVQDHILSCSIGFKYREKHQKGGRSICVTFLVTKKQKKPLRPIPKQLRVLVPISKGVFRELTLPTDVVQINQNVNFQADISEEIEILDRADASASNIMCGNRIKVADDTLGTLGCFLQRRNAKTGELYLVLISNAHVLWPHNLSKRSVYGQLSGSTYTEIGERDWRFGPTFDYPDDPYTDISLAKLVKNDSIVFVNKFLNPDIEPPIDYLRQDQEKSVLHVHAVSAARGERKRGLLITRTDVPVIIKGTGTKFTFRDVYLIKPYEMTNGPFTEGMDSGMVWITSTQQSDLRRRAMGLHFAGNEEMALAVPFDRIMDSEGIDIEFLQ